MATETPEGWEVTVHRSLTRPILLAGGERELVLMLAIIAGIFIISLFRWWSVAVGVGLWIVGMWVLQRMAEKDPQFSKTAIRAIRYRKWLAPATNPFAPPRIGKE